VSPWRWCCRHITLHEHDTPSVARWTCDHRHRKLLSDGLCPPFLDKSALIRGREPSGDIAFE
jgi:hypothetical protein